MLNTYCLFKKNFFFYWNRVDLQCCVSFRYRGKWFSHVLGRSIASDSVTPWTVAPPGRNTGVGCHSLFHIFPTQGLNRGLLHCRQILYHLSHQGIPIQLYIDINIYRYKYMCVCAQSLSCVWLLVTTWTVACQAPRSMGFSRQKFWSGLPFPPPGDLPNPGIEPTSPASPSLAGRFFTTEPPRSIL